MKKGILISLPVLAATFVLLYSNLFWVQKGGVLDGVIAGDKFHRMDTYVKTHTGWKEGVRIIRLFPNGIQTAHDIELIHSFQKELENYFCDPRTKKREAVVASLDTAFNYWEVNGTIYSCRYTHTAAGCSAFERDGAFDVARWTDQVRNDPSVYGSLLVLEDPGNAGGIQALASFILFPESDNEIEVFRRVVEFMEKRHISGPEWFVKSDIHPAEKNYWVAGWIMARGLIDGALDVDMFKLIALGMAISVFALYLSLGSFRQALIGGFSVILLSLIWTRGVIGVFCWLGFEIRERVFVLLAYANNVVQGISFCLHLFESYNGTRGKAADRESRWRLARQEVGSLIAVTAFISSFGFLTLFSFSVPAIRELGIISSLGIVSLWILAGLFLPALHTIVGGEAKPSGFGFHAVGRMYERIAELCLTVSRGLSPRNSTGIVLALASVAGAFFLTGRIVVGTEPIQYIEGTLIHRAEQFLDDPANEGNFDFIEILLEPNASFGKTLREPKLYDPGYVRRAWRFSEAVRSRYGRADGILNIVHRISLQTSGDEMPASRQLLWAIFEIYVSMIDGPVRGQMYDPSTGRIRISVPMKEKSSVVFGRIREEIVGIARSFPGLQVSLFGRVSTYPSNDTAIITGKPINALSSQLVVIAFSAVWIFLLGAGKIRRYRSLKVPLKFGIAMSVPFLFSSAAIMIVMALFGITLDVATASIGVLAISGSIDFSLYIAHFYFHETLSGSDHGRALERTLTKEGPIVVADVFLNVLCFFPLIFSQFLPIARLGWIMGVMLVFAGIGSLMLMPPLFPWAVTRKRGFVPGSGEGDGPFRGD